ncbi:MAG TPA: OmpH family outer membrane protein [Cyclobacteriaceae bacterium]|nr:OmpH family outer membrane protein [Cyclobacteriaceae bacterium]
MKNASLVLNGVLLVAVAVLYFLHFSSGKSSGSSFSGSSSTPSDLKVAYVNQDTLLKYYDFVKVNSAKLEATAKSFDDQLVARQSSLQKEVQAYQAGASNLTMGQARDIEESLQRKGQNLQMFQQTLQQQMMEERSRISQELYEKITAYVKDYCKERGIVVVMKYDRESDLLFGGDSLDISKDVIKGLNDAWKVELQNPAKKDSTGIKGK